MVREAGLNWLLITLTFALLLGGGGGGCSDAVAEKGTGGRVRAPRVGSWDVEVMVMGRGGPPGVRAAADRPDPFEEPEGAARGARVAAHPTPPPATPLPNS